MNLDAKVNNEIFRKDHAIIIALNRHLADLQPVRLEHLTAGYSAGQVVARRVSSGYWEKWSSVSGSTYDSISILFEDVTGDQFTGSTGTAMARSIYGGDVFKDKCIELDATAITALKGRTIVNGGDNIFKF